MIFSEDENQGTNSHEVYDTTDWDERKLLKFLNHTENRHFKLVEVYLISIIVLLIIVLVKVW